MITDRTGPFDSRAHESSLELWADLNRWWIALGMAAAAGAGIYVVKSRGSRPRAIDAIGRNRAA